MNEVFRLLLMCILYIRKIENSNISYGKIKEFLGG